MINPTRSKFIGLRPEKVEGGLVPAPQLVVKLHSKFVGLHILRRVSGSDDLSTQCISISISNWCISLFTPAKYTHRQAPTMVPLADNHKVLEDFKTL